MPNLPLPLLITVVVTVLCAVWSFLYGLFTRNYSTVDRLWSVLPAVYVLIWLPSFLSSPRFIIAGIIVLAWAFRLTRNFAVKGGYRMERGRFVEEDYRWAVMRSRIPNRFAFEVFNLLFISIFQLALIFGFTYPLFIAGGSSAPLSVFDIILFAAHALLLTLETVADQQQFAYYRNRGTTGDPRISAGFNTFGLWKYSRHPNYVCEMGQWLLVSLYPLSASLNWWPSGLSALVLVALFAGSTRLAETISAGKYPLYESWKKATPAWLPFSLPFRREARRRFWQEAGVF